MADADYPTTFPVAGYLRVQTQPGHNVRIESNAGNHYWYCAAPLLHPAIARLLGAALIQAAAIADREADLTDHWHGGGGAPDGTYGVLAALADLPNRGGEPRD